MATRAGALKAWGVLGYITHALQLKAELKTAQANGIWKLLVY